MKKLSLLLLTVILCCSLMFSLTGCSTQIGTLDDEVNAIKNYENTFVSEDLVYVETNNGAEYSLVDVVASAKSTLRYLTVPSVINGKPVTSIGAYAFYKCTALVRLSFEANSNIKTIGEWAFYDLATLRTLVGSFPASIEEIKLGAFCKTRFTTVQFEDGSALKTIGDRAFSGCLRITTVVLPEGLKTIGQYSFDSCTALNSISIPNSIESIGEWSFYACDALANADNVVQVQKDGDVYKKVSGDSLVDYSNEAVVYENTYYVGNSSNPYLVLFTTTSKTITSCAINENTRFICGSAFYGCKSIETIAIPASVESIGAFAFCECQSLKTVTLGENSKLTSIGKYAFYMCDSLESNATDSIN